jgi:hypothetical protein
MSRFSRRRRRKLFWILSLIVAGSMVCSLVATLAPPQRRARPTPQPTRVIPTWTPTFTPTPRVATPAPPTLGAPEAPTEQP